MWVLHLEPDRKTAQPVALALGAERMRTESCETVEDALSLLRYYRFDALITELCPDEMDAKAFIHTVRREYPNISLIVLSRYTQRTSVIDVLGAGADDYITKPFHRDELVARIRAVVRRRSGYSCSLLEAGGLVLDLNRQAFTINGHKVHLTAKEFKILELLMLRKNRLVAKEAFLDKLYGIDEPDPNIVNVWICKVRKKIVEVAGVHPIRNVHGRGYVIEDDWVSSSKQRNKWVAEAA